MTESCEFTLDSDDGSLVVIDNKVFLSDTGALLRPACSAETDFTVLTAALMATVPVQKHA